MLQHISFQLSAILLFLSGAAAVIAVLRMTQPIQPLTNRPAGMNTRTMVLFSFAIYLLGASIREVVVLANDPGFLWGHASLVFSCLSRSLQVAGATLFVGAVTHRECGHWIWTIFLACAVVFGIALRWWL